MPAADNAPIVRTEVAVRDIATTVAFIRSRRGIGKVNLIGWSWGTTRWLVTPPTTMLASTSSCCWRRSGSWKRQPRRSWRRDRAYRIVERAASTTRWLNGVPEHKKAEVLPEAWFEACADATFASGQAGPGPAQLMALNGTIQDAREYWLPASRYDPALFRPGADIHAEWDRDCPIEMARAVFERLTSAPYRRWVEIGEGTHSVFMEKNRWQVFDAVDGFLGEQPRT